jgi:hypothetical protein
VDERPVEVLLAVLAGRLDDGGDEVVVVADVNPKMGLGLGQRDGLEGRRSLTGEAAVLLRGVASACSTSGSAVAVSSRSC